MEPCRTLVKGRRIRRPFAVVPFLYYYDTDDLSHFIRAHLDPPFNERFSKFIEIVRMKGIDYVRLSAKDLERLCDGEGDHISDLKILQAALDKPKRSIRSPHVRDIFSLPSLGLTFAPQGVPDIFGSYTAELTFDYPDDDEVEPVFECIIPLPSTPSPLPSLELPSAEEGNSAALTPSPPSSSPSDEGDDGDSLIDMFSPISPSVSPFSELAGAVPDIFDEEHLESLCTPLASPLYDSDDDVDILGLLPPGQKSPKQDESPEVPPVLPEMESGSDVCGSEGAEFRDDDVDSSPVEREHSPLEADAVPLPPTPRAVPIQAPGLPTYPLPSSPLSTGASFLNVENIDRKESGETSESPSSLPRDILLHPSSTATSPHSVSPTQIPLPDLDVISESSTYGEDHEIDIDDLRTVEDGFGLSSFMPDLRSLDFSRPPSPHLDTFSGCDSLSFGFSASPELSAIETPFTSVMGDDPFVAVSPSTSYRGPYEHLPEFFFDSERIVAKTLNLARDPGLASTGLSAGPEVAAARRPRLEVTIPPSLLEDQALTSLMSSIEPSKAKSQGWISLTPPPLALSLLRSSSTGSDRSIWPVRSTVAGRRLLSPHMKEPSKPSTVLEGGENVIGEQPQGSPEPTNAAHEVGVSELPPPPLESSPSPLPSKFPAPSVSPQHLTSASATVIGRVGGFLRTILTPVGPGDDEGEDRLLLPGGLS